VGEKRLALERARGGVSLPLPDQEIDRRDGRWMLDFRQPLPVENWNAQISLLTGMAAAQLMIEGKVGVLRTVPPADPRDITRLHRVARALRIDWPDSTTYPDFIRGLDPARPNHAAMLTASTRLLRGAAYVAFRGTVPDHPEHSALATTYTHVTAPLRRLVDRYSGEICVALCAGKPVPDWVTARLEQLPDTMRDSSHRAGQYEAEVVNLVEAAMLADDVGRQYEGVIIEADDKDPSSGKVMVTEPAVEARVSSERPLPLGEEVRVKLVEVDPDQRLVRFQL
jgi:exoribonuclease R